MPLFTLKHRSVCAAALCLLGALLGGHEAIAAGTDDPAAQIEQARLSRTADNAAFVRMLTGLEQNQASLTPLQQWQVRYLRAWQTAYLGDSSAGRAALENVADHTPFSEVRADATATLINTLDVQHDYRAAFRRLDDELEQLPNLTDKEARQHVQLQAAQFMTEAGQFDRAIGFTDQVLKDQPNDRYRCLAMSEHERALMVAGRLGENDPIFDSAIATCIWGHETLAADTIRRDQATLLLRQGHTDQALTLLENHYAEVASSHSARLIADYNVLLAQAYWAQHAAGGAEKYAQAAIDVAQKGNYVGALSGAYQLLYQIAREQGDLAQAVAYHEKFVAADSYRMDDDLEKALAYQSIRQQIQHKRGEIAQLDKQNQILNLQRELDNKSLESVHLYVAGLSIVVGSIVLWLLLLKRSQKTFRRLSQRDGLTNALNRQYFVHAAGQSLAEDARHQAPAALLLVDLDHFKRINDAHGHQMGDRVLQLVASICASHLHQTDLFGRMGGEEFAILFRQCAASDTLRRAASLRMAIQAASSVETAGVKTSASIGIALTDLHGHDFHALNSGADQALYRAKREGRNRVVLQQQAGSRPLTREHELAPELSLPARSDIAVGSTES